MICVSVPFSGQSMTTSIVISMNLWEVIIAMAWNNIDFELMVNLKFIETSNAIIKLTKCKKPVVL